MNFVLDDVKDGFVSLEAALERYGLAIDPATLEVDAGGSETRREEIRKARGETKLFHRFEYFQTEAEELQWVNKHMPR